MRRLVLVLVAMWVVAVATPAQADDEGLRIRGLGPRVGVSINPHQFVLGGHLDLGEPFPFTTLRFPVLELGLGDNLWMGSVAVDLYYRLQDRWAGWTPIAGGEVAYYFGAYDLPEGDTNFSDLGLVGIVGLEREVGGNNRFGVEIKLGFLDAPDFKFLAVWTFGD